MKSIATALNAHFTDEERLKLVLEALARRDVDEAKRLHEGCPRHAYKVSGA